MFPSSSDPLKRRKGSQNTFVFSNQVDLISSEEMLRMTTYFNSLLSKKNLKRFLVDISA